MKSLVEHLSQYAEYHRDRRNIATHFVGIPMIVLGFDALIARPMVRAASFGAVPISPALFGTIAAATFYLALDRRYGAVMSALLALSLAAAIAVADRSTSVWLLGSGALFLGGWALQFVGHHFEGKKPAFVDDLVGLLLGPLFLLAEAGFAVGWRDDVRAEVERRVGPTRAGRMSRAPSRIAS